MTDPVGNRTMGCGFEVLCVHLFIAMLSPDALELREGFDY